MKTFLRCAAFICGMLMGLLLALAIGAKAQHKSELSKLMEGQSELKFELGVGQCRFGPSPDGMWWQKDQEHSNRYKTNGCIEWGVAGKVNPLFGWSLRWVDLGQAHTNALAIACANDDCSKTDRTQIRRAECSAGIKGDCLYQWKGAGGIKGVNFALSMEMLRHGHLSLEGELGVLVYRMRWSEQIYPMGCDGASCPWRYEVEQKTGYYASPEVSLIARYKYLWAGTRYYTRTSQHVPISAGISGPAQTWMAGVQVPF